MEHKMMVASPSLTVARRRGVNKNHSLRVWCTCMAAQKYAPGYFSMRRQREVEPDTRRLGGWDDLGVVDVRVPGSALDLWREHVREAESRA